MTVDDDTYVDEDVDEGIEPDDQAPGPTARGFFAHMAKRSGVEYVPVVQKEYNPLQPQPMDDGDITPVDPLVSGMIERKSVSVWYGDSGRIKTWMAQDLQASLAADDLWLNHFRVAGLGTSLYLDWDDGSDRLRQRWQKLVEGRQQTDRAQPCDNCVKLLSHPPLNFDHEAFWPNLEKLAHDTDLIIIDSLGAATEANENDPAYGTPIYRLKGITDRTGCTFLVLSHVKKGGSSEIRGHNKVKNAADSTYFVDLVKETKDARGESVLDVKIVQKKARGGKKLDPFVVRLRDTDDGRGTVLEVIDTEPTAKPQARRTSRQSGRKKHTGSPKGRVLELLGRSPGLSQNDVIERLGINRKVAGALLKAMREAGEVTHSTGERGAFIYSLP